MKRSSARLRAAMLGSLILAALLALAPTPSARGANLLLNSDFSNGQTNPWAFAPSAPGAASFGVVNGELCLTVTNAGANRWDVQFRQPVTLQNGHSYAVSFKAYASAPTRLYAKIGNSNAPYAEYWNNNWTPFDLTTAAQTFGGSFTMNGDDQVANEFAFHLGGDLALPALPFTLCVDDIVLDDPQYTPDPTPEPVQLPTVRVNQLGYLPNLAKQAIVVNPATSRLDWQLKNASGNVVAKGKTLVRGQDQDSGDFVHLVDFSWYTKAGTGYTLVVNGDSSHPFDIGKDIYRALKYDALAYFYHNRSGIALTLPYAADAKWTRPAGHIGVTPNLGDTSVPCAPGIGCDYALDVSGGWYDAGDHGKYVVNGGISVWTMLNQYERAKYFGSLAALSDGRLNIPEKANGVPDILDEARWELEFLLKMQVPAGQPLAGMAHHKIHDANWTGLGLKPSDDPQQRYLRPPSTAATLNLAATAAQGARIWKTIDPAFAAKCLAAAQRAWAAAQANPAILALPSDGSGGGAYDDSNVSDEFYWAASELFVTTGDNAYHSFLTSSPYYLAVPTSFGPQTQPAMTWGNTEALGTISLAVVPNKLPRKQIDKARLNVVVAANKFGVTLLRQGYLVPFAPSATGKYPWGSNSFILNNVIVIGLAYDFTHNPLYLSAVGAGMDYLLGRNPMDQSYITGYGDRALQNPHHRFWAHQVNPSFPAAHPGAVSGGPNSGLEDPYAQSIGLPGCAPQKCFVDHIESWSTNEITINWNAPLAWVTAFLDEHSRR
jgi:endoglucanase